MAVKSDFTPEEWQGLEFAMIDTMQFMGMVDPGFWASFKEAGAAAKFIANRANSSPSTLVRDLAHDIHMKRDETVVANPTNIEAPTLERIKAAVAALAEKAPDELPAFRDLISGVARSSAEASDGVSGNETEALAKIDEALG